MKKKLVLFDIDGTLIRHIASQVAGGWPRFIHAAKIAYGVDVQPNLSKNYNGWVDRQILFDIVGQHGVSKKEFDKNFSLASRAMREAAEQQAKIGKFYEAIPEAVQLATNLSEDANFIVGLLTGNVQGMAEWKLAHAGINTKIFQFGLFGDEVDDRISLAKQIFIKAKTETSIDFSPEHVVIIGDALGDIRCAQAIHVPVIIAATGGHSKEELIKEKPDLLVDSLMDPRVLTLLEIHPS